MAVDPVAGGTLVTLLGGIAAYVIRELKKGKNEKTNNGDIKEIKKVTKENQTALAKLDKGQGIIKTDLTNMRLNCTNTTSRFGKEITENRKDIKDILKERKE